MRALSYEYLKWLVGLVDCLCTYKVSFLYVMTNTLSTQNCGRFSITDVSSVLWGKGPFCPLVLLVDCFSGGTVLSPEERPHCPLVAFVEFQWDKKN
jgi:hypothetical protein